MTPAAFIFLSFSLIFSRSFPAAAARVVERDEATIPAVTTTTSSPPEGNTTFIDGTTWCVALPGVSQPDLQSALDWACGLGMADCAAIQHGGPCFQPDTLLSHASYAFNAYFQQNGNSDVACNFGGTAKITKKDPSYGKCSYASAGSVTSSAVPVCDGAPSFLWWKIVFILLLFYMHAWELCFCGSPSFLLL